MPDQQQHPIIVPVKELKKLWREQAPLVDREEWLIERAAQWGCVQRGEVNEAQLQQARDEELEVTLAVVSFLNSQALADRVRAARRPKPLSLKEQAWKLLECYGTSGVKLTAEQCNTIREALEALPDD